MAIILMLISLDSALHSAGSPSFVILCFSIYNNSSIWFNEIHYIGKSLLIDKSKRARLVSNKISFPEFEEFSTVNREKGNINCSIRIDIGTSSFTCQLRHGRKLSVKINVVDRHLRVRLRVNKADFDGFAERAAKPEITREHPPQLALRDRFSVPIELFAKTFRGVRHRAERAAEEIPVISQSAPREIVR